MQSGSASGILRELVAIATPSSLSNLPLLHWVRNYIESLGWQVQLLPYADERGVAKANFVARPVGFSEDSKIDLAFICHTDTVPCADDWKGALKLEEYNGNLHGCGSCDVKGALACFLAAVVRSGTIRSNVALILTADEEIGCKGMDRLLAANSLRIASAIVSEPTSLRPGIAGKGYGLARITVTGREAHSAFPRQGVSAISAAARLIARIEDQFATSVLNDLFDPPQTTLNIGLIEGGTAKNIIPGRCTFLVEWRAVPGDDPQAILDQLRRIVEEAQAHSSATIHLEGLRAESGFAPAPQGRLQERLSALLTQKPTGISFGSEASRVARISDEVIVIGPGDMRTAHSNRECVSVAELEQWIETLVALFNQ
jgi:acetylornithine deacetylase